MLQVSDGVRFGPGNRIGADHRRGLGDFGILGRIDYGHTRRTRLARHRIARRRFAVQRQTQNFAERLLGSCAGVMRCRSPTVRYRYWPSGEKAICAPNCPPWPSAVAPDHLQSLKARRIVAEGQFGSRQRQARDRSSPGSE